MTSAVVATAFELLSKSPKPFRHLIQCLTTRLKADCFAERQDEEVDPDSQHSHSLSIPL